MSREAEPYEGMVQSLDVLVQTALNDEDLSSRLGAIASLARHAQEDVRVKETLSQLAHSDSNPQVQGAASAVLAGME
jgi:hypothetical protein